MICFWKPLSQVNYELRITNYENLIATDLFFVSFRKTMEASKAMPRVADTAQRTKRQWSVTTSRVSGASVSEASSIDTKNKKLRFRCSKVRKNY